MGSFIDLSGKKIGFWTVSPAVAQNENGHTIWYCKCICGVQKWVVSQSLRNGASVSCGCQAPTLLAKAKTKHGHARGNGNTEDTRTYRIWQAMRSRVRGLSLTSKKYYVPKGIKVCARWDEFPNFLADMGAAPSNLSIDRINNDGHYEPGNCRWATAREQRLNQGPRH